MSDENEFTIESLLGELLDCDPAIRQRIEAQRHRERSKTFKLKGNGIGFDNEDDNE